jgi:hypothetical protein
LVGVTTSSFTAYNEHQGLAQTSLFWGIEDSGRKYQGTREIPTGNMAANTAARHPVLFGNRQVVTVVCDLETRTMTFWRNENLLEVLVTNLPMTQVLIPVVVPNLRGTTVAITGLDGDPLPL